MLAYTLKQLLYSLTTLIILIGIFFAIYQQPAVKEHTDNFIENFRTYLEKYSVKPPERIPEYIRKPQQQEIPSILPQVHAYDTVNQTGMHNATLGYDEHGKLLLATTPTQTIIMHYNNNTLASITANNKTTTFIYTKNILTTLTTPTETNTITYDPFNRLSSYKTSRATHHFVWNSNDQLASHQVGQGIPTTFFYREKLVSYGKTRETLVGYDDKERLRSLQSDDDYLLIHYWRDNLISSLSGAKYGLKESISYGPNDITLISNTDQHTFTGGTDKLRITAINLYLTCTKIKQLPVIFEPNAWVIYHDYFNASMTDYLVNNHVCNEIYDTQLT